MCLFDPHNGLSCNSVLRTAGRKISSSDISGDWLLPDVTIVSINLSIIFIIIILNAWT